MSGWEIAIGIIIMVVCLFLVGVIMLQEGNTRGMGASLEGSSSDSYLDNNRGRTFDAMLAKLTKFSAILFFILTIAMSVLSVLNK